MSYNDELSYNDTLSFNDLNAFTRALAPMSVEHAIVARKAQLDACMEMKDEVLSDLKKSQVLWENAIKSGAMTEEEANEDRLNYIKQVQHNFEICSKKDKLFEEFIKSKSHGQNNVKTPPVNANKALIKSLQENAARQRIINQFKNNSQGYYDAKMRVNAKSHASQEAYINKARAERAAKKLVHGGTRKHKKNSKKSRRSRR